MELQDYSRLLLLLLVLLNPFLLSVYLLDLLQELDRKTLLLVLLRASLIAGICFFVVALIGEALFEDLLQVRYAAFLLFGGAIFLLVGLRMVFQGPDAILKVRGEPEHLAGSIAMPFLIGPGTVNASILIGREVSPLGAAAVIASALVLSMVGVLVIKATFDGVRSRNAKLVQRYVDIVGRISALIVGSIAVEMMLSGIDRWQAG